MKEMTKVPAVSTEQEIVTISLDLLVPYRQHCFSLYEGERLDDMVQSVKKNGILIPLIVRTMGDGRYEILSGHNRVHAAELAGLQTVPAVVKKDLADDEAQVYVVETNLIQRGFKELKISEQAYAVSVRYGQLFDEKKLEKIKEELFSIENGYHEHENNNGVPVGPQEKKRVKDRTAEQYGISSSSVGRLLRINKLSEKLKEYVDNGGMKIRPAVEISFLTDEEQQILSEVIEKHSIEKIDTQKAAALREQSETGEKLTEKTIMDVLEDIPTEDSDTKGQEIKIKLSHSIMENYFGGYSKKDINKTIETAVEQYFENRRKRI